MPDIIALTELESLRMRTFSFYIHDARYSVPTLKLVQTADEREARNQAQAWLEESAHHKAIEVLEGERAVFRIP